MGLWINLKRNKIHADIYKNGEFICSIKVDEQNKGKDSVILFEADNDISFKIVKDSEENSFNKESYNK
jgi:hypothetical protein